MKEYSLFWIKPETYSPMQERSGGDVLKKALPENTYEFIEYVKKSLINCELDIIKEKEWILTKEIAGKHYEEFKWVWCDTFNEDKFEFLLKYMTSWKSYWIVFHWEGAVKKWREVLVSIRDEYLENRKMARLNMTHASDSIESAKREICLHFPDFKLW